MKIALCQINTTVGDLAGNARLIEESLARAAKAGADLAVFPEQSLGGYPALDLWERPGFWRASLQALKDLAKRCQKTAALVGVVYPNPEKTGKPVLNAAALLHRGKIAAVRAKTLLPTYDVFDEARYFAPAKSNAPISFLDRKIGVSVCEDAWARSPEEGRRYGEDPITRQARQGAQVLINISASPFERGKMHAREKLVSGLARKTRKPLLYCNSVGGNDELIFDGGSMAFDARGRLVARAKSFEPDMIVVDPFSPVPTGNLKTRAKPDLDGVASVAAALRLGIRDYLRKCGLQKAVLGLSGGIDSAVTCALAVEALGQDQVTGVAMPSMYSSPQSLKDARALAENLDIRFLTIPIQPIFESYLKSTTQTFRKEPSDLVRQNLQARIRGGLLMALSNEEGSILLSTGNKSELSMGYCTLYGDMCGGLAVLADAPKETVYELARWLNRERPVIPQSSIDRAPTAELKFDQKDQDDLPPYHELDAVMADYVEKRLEPETIVKKGLERRMVVPVTGRMDNAEYKRRQAPPGLKISRKAFGIGRRMPIAKGDYRKSPTQP